MTPTGKHKKEIRGYIQKWKNRLYLQDWLFETNYCHQDEDEAAADIKMQVQYKSAVLRIQPKFWKEVEQQREMIIVHELCHCLVQPLVQLACEAGDGYAVSSREIDHWKESVTQHITNAVFY